MSAAFRREPKPPKPVLSVRSQVDKDIHLAVDIALRDLKKFSRRLHASFNVFSEELQVLDRVFYKGKNQHRSALFFRRVADIRKFGQRIAEYNAPQIVDSCRCSFFGPDAQANSKALKGAWSHVPDDKTMTFLHDRLAAGINLLDKAHERLLNAYRAFILEMQSGFFLQLILTLAALASRLDILVQDLADALRNSWTSMYKLFCALNPSEAKKVSKLQPAGTGDDDKQRLPTQAYTQLFPVVEELVGGGEDTGETIKRVDAEMPVEPSVTDTVNDTPPFDAAKANRPAGAKLEAPSNADDDEDTITVADITAMPAPAQIISAPPPVPPAMPIATVPSKKHAKSAVPPPKQLGVAAPTTKQSGVVASSTKQPKKRPIEDVKAKEPVPKKKKKKKDAIDDIFGF